MTAELNCVDNPHQFEVIELAGVVSPGVVHFPQAPARVSGWDLQSTSGTSGGTPVLHKQPLIEFDVELYLWKGEGSEGEQVDYFAADQWPAFRKVLDSKPTTPITIQESRLVGHDADGNAISVNGSTIVRRPTGLEIKHPLLTNLRPAVTMVVVKSYTEPLPDGKGGATVKITFIEFRPPKSMPVGPPLTSKTTQKSDENQARRDQLAYRAWRNKNPGSSLLGTGSDLTFDDWVNAGRPR